MAHTLLYVHDMMTLLEALARDDHGQDMAEYGIALAIIAVSVAAAAMAISNNIQQIWNTTSSITGAL